jgi:hypothetical protein
MISPKLLLSGFDDLSLKGESMPSEFSVFMFNKWNEVDQPVGIAQVA